MKLHFSVVLLALAATSGAQAQNQDRSVRGFLAAGLTGGGETLATVVYTDGHSQSVKSGGLVELIGGFDYHESQ